MTQNLINHGPKIALFEPDIPQNTAAIIRTCACLGAKLEIIEPCGFMLSDGVPNEVHKKIKDRLKIPMKNNKRSLNIASSVAIILAESLKQTKLI